MPRYDYRCLGCEAEFTVVRLMCETLDKCPECDTEGEVQKVYSTLRKTGRGKNKKKVGEVVNEFIEETKKTVKQEKQKLKKKEYKA